MKTIPKLTATILIAIGLMVGVIVATYTVVIHEIGDEGVNYMRSQE